MPFATFGRRAGRRPAAEPGGPGRPRTVHRRAREDQVRGVRPAAPARHRPQRPHRVGAPDRRRRPGRPGRAAARTSSTAGSPTSPAALTEQVATAADGVEAAYSRLWRSAEPAGPARTSPLGPPATRSAGCAVPAAGRQDYRPLLWQQVRPEPAAHRIDPAPPDRHPTRDWSHDARRRSPSPAACRARARRPGPAQQPRRGPGQPGRPAPDAARRRPLGLGWAELQVTVAQRAQIEALLRAGVNVICDDTNLRARVAAGVGRTGRPVAAPTWSSATSPTSRSRSASPATPTRTETDRVGEEVHPRHVPAVPGRADAAAAGTAGPAAAAPPASRSTPRPGHPGHVLVDIDGTVALMDGRSPYDMSRVRHDPPNHAVISAVRAMHAAGYPVVFCSGAATTAARRHRGVAAIAHVGVPYDGAAHAGRPATSARTRSSRRRSSTGRSGAGTTWSASSTTATRWCGCGGRWA